MSLGLSLTEPESLVSFSLTPTRVLTIQGKLTEPGTGKPVLQVPLRRRLWLRPLLTNSLPGGGRFHPYKEESFTPGRYSN
ncbi:hypothetical protein CTA1_4421 [Colletotrichum tanaceti]|uniref:Uncharacterized protein n=1 Tax=Colletotrichum tanaceti TaxID=1306861 RepID=A0A4U6X1V2_9PEZI|nr:hypothetical protein CTA1_4421 [Colletotrichum tanaceti]